MNYQYNHIGIPTTEPREGERYSPTFKMYTSGGEPPLRIQWHRFDEGSSLHPLIQTKPHVAFKVDNLEEAVAGKTILLEPYEPFKGFKVAIVESDGILLEFIETTLTEEEIWNTDKHKDSIIYPKSEK